HRLQDDTRIEVDIRIELPLDEVLVVESNALELQREIEERLVLLTQLFEHLVAGPAHHRRARIVVLVNAVPEPHQPERIVLVLGAGDEFGNTLLRTDLPQHAQYGLVGAAMRGAPERSNAGGDAGEGVGAA